MRFEELLSEVRDANCNVRRETEVGELELVLWVVVDLGLIF